MMSISELLWDLQYRWPFMFRLKGTVILRIWWQCLFVIFYTIGVVSLHIYVPLFHMEFPLTLIPVLGVVIGLLLVFRTNTAYDRYWEGRRLWSSMTQNIRTLTRCIWVGVKENGTARDVIEKCSVINLLVAFAYATKNYLREEYDYESDGISDLIQHIPRYSTTPSWNQPEERKPSDQQPKDVQPGSGNPPGGHVTCNVPPELEHESKTGIVLSAGTLLNKKKQSIVAANKDKDDKKEAAYNASKKRLSISQARQFSFTAHDCVTPTNIPIQLSYYIHSYIYVIKQREATDRSTMLIMNRAVESLVDCLTGFERILRTPIPLAYSVHLHHSIWLYVLSLPYQLVGQLGWWTVPAVTLASFALLGILGIGWEIENPFGYDDNDLPLDDFCKVIHKEIQVIVGHKIPLIDSWIMSPQNRPFAPGSLETAQELITQPEAELRRKLAVGATRRIT